VFCRGYNSNETLGEDHYLDWEVRKMDVTLQLNCNVSCCDTKGYKIYRITKIPFIDTMEWCLQLLNEEAISTFNSTFSQLVVSKYINPALLLIGQLFEE
jgi:hypothetical protein